MCCRTAIPTSSCPTCSRTRYWKPTDGPNFETITRNHLALLDQNPAIKHAVLERVRLADTCTACRSVTRNGKSTATRRVCRCCGQQRTEFVIWNVPAPGFTARSRKPAERARQGEAAEQPDHSSISAKTPVLPSQLATLPVFSLGTPPARPPAPTTSGAWLAVDACDRHTCGIRSDGTVACWGSNTNGNGIYVGQADPPSVTLAAISAGSLHSCGLRTDGTIECWGADHQGQLEVLTGKFESVSAGSWHSCGLRIDGSVACWGSNDRGQADPPPGGFVSVSAGTQLSPAACAANGEPSNAGETTVSDAD